MTNSLLVAPETPDKFVRFRGLSAIFAVFWLERLPHEWNDYTKWSL